MKKLFETLKSRPFIQAAATVASNPHIGNFFSGVIHKGASKSVCVPGLNCYSCPAAAGACPIGSLQAVIGGRKYSVSFYVAGFLILFGALFGRLVCGFMCPFGFLQDLLHRIPAPRLKVPKKVDKPLRKLKYVILAVFVVLLPMLLTDAYGTGSPYFCKLICPAGTLEGGLPLLAANGSLRTSVGWLFGWKAFVLIAVLALSVFIHRPFCKYICPLGAIYSFFNRWSFYRMEVDETACVHCGVCEKKCPMQVEVTKNINSAECIRCGECRKACPHGAISSGFCAGYTLKSKERGS